jgi:two-component system, OmpR family, osmolarity sensor histidine kinase EnvZ
VPIPVKPSLAPGLFWRTFLLILLLLAASSVAWLQIFRIVEREPRAQQLAAQIVAIVNITRSALLYSDPIVRLALLADLADNQGIRIVPLEQSDTVQPFAGGPVATLAGERVTTALGPRTRLAAEVNGVAGIWVSFAIDADEYWVVIDRDPLALDAGTRWIGWAAIAAVASLLAAAAITRVVNRPLARLSQAAEELGSGRTPEPLPESGPAEIATVNASFNRMVADLAQSERDRAVLLAGISHDLRTPLTRQYRRWARTGDRGAHRASAWRPADAHACRRRGAVRAACAPHAAPDREGCVARAKPKGRTGVRDAALRLMSKAAVPAQRCNSAIA